MKEIAHNVFVETRYDGVNVGAIQTGESIIAIDAPSYPKEARDWVLQLNAIHHKSISNLILTDYNGDRVINSRWFHSKIIAHAETARKLKSYDRRYPTALLESLIARNAEKGRNLSNSPVEKAIFSFSDDFSLYKGATTIELIAAPGPTRGNIWVFLPNEKILFAGDTLTTSMPPIIVDGNSEQWLLSLNKLREWQDKVDIIVPGRGEFGDISAIDDLCAYLTLMRTRMNELIEAERPFAETAIYVREFMELYPHHQLPQVWIRQQIHKTLNHIYHEIKITKDGIVMRVENEFE